VAVSARCVMEVENAKSVYQQAVDYGIALLVMDKVKCFATAREVMFSVQHVMVHG